MIGKLNYQQCGYNLLLLLLLLLLTHFTETAMKDNINSYDVNDGIIQIAVLKGENNMYRHPKAWNKTESDYVIWESEQVT